MSTCGPFADHLYFVQAESGPVKIGRALDPGKRVAQLKIGSHEPLTLMGQLDGRGFEEKVWHTAFQDDRLTGEWFSITGELRKAIKLALAGEPWWDQLTPPFAFPLSDDPEEYDDDCVDWQIAIRLAVVDAANGRFKGTQTPSKVLKMSDQRIVELITCAAEGSYREPDSSRSPLEDNSSHDQQ